MKRGEHPHSSSSRASLPLNIKRAIDSSCDDYESGLKAGQPPSLADFLERVAEPWREHLLAELLLLEIEYRHRAGQSASLDSLAAAHPELSREEIKSVVAIVSTRGHDRAAGETPGSTGEPVGLQIRCPQCHHRESIQLDGPLTDLECGTCGGTIRIVRHDGDSAPIARVGHFELHERLGMGAFGTVWRGYDTVLNRSVAVKIPRHALLGPEGAAAFLREARLAAQLAHPNIVSVHEIVADEETIYIVSDYIDGTPLAEIIQQQRFTPREAAELIAKIAVALHHAHEAGIVHRDLKPQNILIDRSGEPHITDFGLARQDVGGMTMTFEGEMLGTPAYMSPEQAQGGGHLADRRSDVYSLGVILFELLTGELPFRGSVQMVVEQLLYSDPPGARLFDNRIPRDLETIAAKCLEKQPAARYPDALAVADELRRQLRGEPIDARPLGRAARLGRWCRRNRMVAGLAGVTAGLLVFTATVGLVSAAVVSRQKDEAERQRAAAEQVIDTMIETFRSPDPYREGHSITVAESLESAVRGLRGEFADRPEVRGKLLAAVGRTYLGLNLDADAMPLLEEACQLLEEHLGPDHRDVIEAKMFLARARRDTSVGTDTIDDYRRLLAQSESLFGDADDLTIDCMRELATSLSNAGQSAEAIEVLRRAIRVADRQEAKSTLQFALAAVHADAAEYDAATELLVKLVEQERATQGEDHPAVLNRLAALAKVHTKAGRIDEAALLFQDLVERYTRAFGEDHTATHSVMYAHAEFLHASGQIQAATEAFETLCKLRLASLGPASRATLKAQGALASCYKGSGSLEEASQLAEEVHRQAVKHFGDDDIMTLSTTVFLAENRMAGGDFPAAIALLEEVVPRCQRILGKQHAHSLRGLLILGEAQMRVGQMDQATSTLAEARELLTDTYGPHHALTLAATSSLANCRASRGEYEAAVELMQVAFDTSVAMLGEDHPQSLMFRGNLGVMLQYAGRLEEAFALHEQTLERMQKRFGAKHPHALNARFNLAVIAELTGQLSRAVELMEATLAGRIEAMGESHPATGQAAAELERLKRFRAGKPPRP